MPHFKAQALDNTSPDHYQSDYVLLSEESPHRKFITQEISRIARDGKFVLNTNRAQIIVYYDWRTGRDDVLVQIPTEQKDQAGRRNDIVCIGAANDVTLDSILAFAQTIDRTISNADIESIAPFIKRHFRDTTMLPEYRR